MDERLRRLEREGPSPALARAYERAGLWEQVLGLPWETTELGQRVRARVELGVVTPEAAHLGAASEDVEHAVFVAAAVRALGGALATRAVARSVSRGVEVARAEVYGWDRDNRRALPRDDRLAGGALMAAAVDTAQEWSEAVRLASARSERLAAASAQDAVNALMGALDGNLYRSSSSDPDYVFIPHAVRASSDLAEAAYGARHDPVRSLRMLTNSLRPGVRAAEERRQREDLASMLLGEDL